MRVLRYLSQIMSYAVHSARTTAYAVLFLALFGTLLEFAALSVLIPLSQHVNHSSASIISRTWIAAIAWFGVSPDIKIWFELFLGLLLARVLLQFSYSVLVSRVSRQVAARLSSSAFGTFVIDTSLLEIQKQKVGHFIAIAGDEANRAGQIFLYFCQLLISLLSVIVTIAAMIVFSIKLAIGVALFTVVTAAMILQSTRRIYHLGGVMKSESRIATSTFLDGLNGLRSVRSIGGERYVVDQYADQVKKYHRTLFRVDFTSHSQRNIPLIVLLMFALALILSLSAAGISRFDMTSTVASLILLIRFFPSAGACLNNGMKLLSDLRAAHDVVSVASALRPHLAGSSTASTGTIRTIELSDLTYRYEPDRPLLESLSYRFDAGTTYAICGGSGSGKSTLVDLMVGLIPNAQNSIRVNDVPISELDPRDLRRRIVLVEQQSRVFNDTVRNNIVFGIEADDAEVLRVIELAGLGELLRSMPQGLDSMLDYQGTNLSGGQRQRLGIARALLRNPDVLILDESLSALDTATRNRVLSNVLAAFADRVVIIVTHDASIASRMQHVLALDARTAADDEAGDDAADYAARSFGAAPEGFGGSDS
jgi:ABC-type multidrug transport system fused ATPase/permease subunit